jgi:pyruvate carboxylase subunit B
MRDAKSAAPHSDKSAKRAAPPKGPGLRKFNVFVDGEYFEVEVEAVGGPPLMYAPTAPAPQQWAPPPTPVAPAPQAAPVAEPALAPASPSAPVYATNIVAPMPGMVIRYEVKQGDRVNVDDVVLILEAMKMENSIPSSVAGTVLHLERKEGETVQKGDVLVVIG